MITPRETIVDIEEFKTDEYDVDWRHKLNLNENVYGANQNVISAIKNFDVTKISLYPTCDKIVEKFAKKYEINKENILLSNGSNEALKTLIDTFLDKNEEVLSYTPTNPKIATFAKITGGLNKTIYYNEKFRFDFEKFSNNISENTKIAYIATPNNPTGEVVSRAEIEILSKKHENTLFIIDCTYTNFSQNVVIEDYIDLTKEYENIAVIKSYSSDFALAGIRFGIIFAIFKSFHTILDLFYLFIDYFLLFLSCFFNIFSLFYTF